MENRLKFLSQASEILVAGEEVRKLSSHLRYLQDVLLNHGVWNIPKSKDLLPSNCPQCFTEFKFTSCRLTVKASPKPSHNLVKIMRKESMSEHLTGAQTVLLSNYKDTRGKKLLLKCGICRKETEVNLKKQQVQSKRKAANSLNLQTRVKENHPRTKGNSVPTPHLNKRKKKDQFAGLKKTAVMSLKCRKTK